LFLDAIRASRLLIVGQMMDVKWRDENRMEKEEDLPFDNSLAFEVHDAC
jgi:hypothetical protein